MTTVDPASDPDERQVRLTGREALANVRTVLELCSAGELRCSDKTNRPTAATIRTIDAHLAIGNGPTADRLTLSAYAKQTADRGRARTDLTADVLTCQRANRGWRERLSYGGKTGADSRVLGRNRTAGRKQPRRRQRPPR